jgi:hypothetical protein
MTKQRAAEGVALDEVLVLIALHETAVGNLRQCFLHLIGMLLQVAARPKRAAEVEVLRKAAGQAPSIRQSPMPSSAAGAD